MFQRTDKTCFSKREKRLDSGNSRKYISMLNTNIKSGHAVNENFVIPIQECLHYGYELVNPKCRGSFAYAPKSRVDSYEVRENYLV